METAGSNKLIKSKERVQQHGEVFTPQWMVKKMLAEPGIRQKLRDIHATFLEPSAGEGAFLTEILRQKLSYVNESSASHNADWQYDSLWALASIYGIEYLPDNLAKARENMICVFCENYRDRTGDDLSKDSDFYRSAQFLIRTNIVQGNTLTHRTETDELIRFSEWQQDEAHEHQVRRHEFAYDDLFAEDRQDSIEMSLFADEQRAEPPTVDLMRVWELEE